MRQSAPGEASKEELSASLLALRQYYKSRFNREWREDNAVTLVMFVLVIMLVWHVSLSHACNVVGLLGHSHSKVQQLVSPWLHHRQWAWRDQKPRGAAAPKYMAEKRRTGEAPVLDKLTPEQVSQIEVWLDSENAEGRLVTVRRLQRYVQQEWALNLSSRRLRQYLHEAGAKYGKGIEVAVVDEAWHQRRIAKYVVRYAHARQLESRGTHVIVYTDESYCFNNHAENYGWFSKNSLRHVRRTKRKGRFVIFHAITRDGLLYSERSEHDGDLTQSTLNAEYLYPVDTDKKGDKNTTPDFSYHETPDVVMDKAALKEDYHGYINDKLWLHWWLKRLTPAFEARYPGRKMILCMDNARYHTPSGGAKGPWAMKKAELVQKYTELGWSTTGKTATAMKVDLAAWYRQHPELRPKSQIAIMMADKGWQLMYTPPLEPAVQPIERIWGQVKGLVASKYHIKRGMDETLLHLREAFYTHCYGSHKRGANGEGGITSKHCEGSIQKSERWMSGFIKNHSDLLAGTLTDLKFIDTLLPFHTVNAQSAAHMADIMAEENAEDAEFEARASGEVEVEQQPVQQPTRTPSTVAAGIMMTLPVLHKWRRIELKGYGDEPWAEGQEMQEDAELLLQVADNEQSAQQPTYPPPPPLRRAVGGDLLIDTRARRTCQLFR